ncbi:hypothetical protein [uncultured Maribacter sp.]|uniref:hypothetical protein n=1 Tax=uncultured Maribacter sp. TaxID=431308 RepID=UPI0030EDD46D
MSDSTLGCEGAAAPPATSLEMGGKPANGAPTFPLDSPIKEVVKILYVPPLTLAAARGSSVQSQ